jgi:hypothetical protein
MIFFVVSFDHFIIVPEASPTRGSGLGADVRMSGAGIGPVEDDEDMVAHAAANTTPAPSDTRRNGESAGFTWGTPLGRETGKN